MRKICLIALILSGYIGFSQSNISKNNTSLDFETGLLLTFEDSAYVFQLGGFIQPSFVISQFQNGTSNLFLNPKRAFLHIGGAALNENVSFFIQTNFSESRPLFDAYIKYTPKDWLNISFGQKQNIANNREMLFREDRLQFTERGILSEDLSHSGREFGIFLESKFGEKIGISPMFAVTSGDGRNSFGLDSRDVDIGGLKYAGRLDFYPLGYFTPGNDLFSVDLLHESSPKVVIGSAYSINYGASSSVGEGHGDFFLYNLNGEEALPNYRKLYADIMAKYKGFSLLAEFGNSTAAGLSDNFSDESATQRLSPQEISKFLLLGNSYNFQLGYVTKKGYSFDLRYGQSQPEFASFAENLMQENKNYTVGFTKYFRMHHSKLQTAFSVLNDNNNQSTIVGELMFQIAF